MRFTHKLRKLGDGQTWQSMQRRVGLALLTRRPIFQLDPNRIVRSINDEQFKRIRQRYAAANPGNAWPKYLDLSTWITVNLRRVRDLRLDFGFRKRILDIGCGTGYFLHICKRLGHDVLGLDIDDVPMYGEMTRKLGLNRVLWRVRPFEPLPDLGPPFDLITCFQICFNGHGSQAVWRSPEWQFFLNDLVPRLRPGGRIHLQLNRERNGNHYDEELRRFFETCAAEIDEGRITISFGKPAGARLVTTCDRAGLKHPTQIGHLQPLPARTHSAAAGSR
jgi:SAM-dependent methyltransferase